MDWIFVAFFVASMLYMGEEYFYPCGFMDVMKRLNPRFAPLVTAPMAIVINGLQLLLCVIAILVGRSLLAFSMSVAALLFINAFAHMMGSLIAKGYAPGVITGVLLYLPLDAESSHRHWHTGSGVSSGPDKLFCGGNYTTASVARHSAIVV